MTQPEKTTPEKKITEKKITEKKFTGKKVFLWFFGFFLIVFMANGIMAYIAVGTWGGLETDDAYRKGIFYNQEISASEEQKKSGWVISLSHIPDSLDDQKINVLITWPEGDLPPKKVSAFINRSVTNAYDQEIILTKSENNIYTGSLILPEPGQWNIDVLVTRDKNTIYQHKEKIFVAK
ncbi:MAG: FixH family protein [Emcibacter sp.]|nr:FixH family protein [Emcibacter sp.]